jgi:hypothetical protein
MLKKLVLAVFAAALLLSVAVGTASASRSIVSSARVITALWEALRFSAAEFEAPVVCRVSITLSLTSERIAKVIGAQIGTAAASVLRREECTGGSGTALEEGRQRWPVIYQGFNGTLPRFSGVRVDLQRSAFLVSAAGGLSRCLYEGTAQGIINVEGGGRVTSVTAEEGTRLPSRTRLAGALFCPANGTFSGTSTTVGEVRLTLA